MTMATGREGKPPNVVVVLCDQLRSFAVGSWGNAFVRTPHIDALASTGYRFELGVTNCPACTPARSTLLAGQHARTCVGSRINEMQPNGTILGRDDRAKFPDTTLAEAFRNLGYRTAQIGKWHVDTRPSRLGFERSLIVRNTYSKGDFIRDEGEPFGVPGFTADYELAEARRFFSEARTEPFFLFYNILSPHMPLLDVPYRYSRLYDPARVPLRDNVTRNGRLPADERWFQIYMWETFHDQASRPVTATAMPDFTIRDLTALYYGSVTWTDDLLGELMASLRENGLENDTIVVFASDHGDMLGSHHLWDKGQVAEEAIRIPIVYRWPGGIRPGASRTRLTSLMDVMPTLLDLCGGAIPGHVQGRSQARLLRGAPDEDDPEDNVAVIESPLRELAIRTPTHLYAVAMAEDDSGVESDAYLFFDLRDDPFQRRNLVRTNEQAGLARTLRDRLVQWDRTTPRLANLDYRPFGGRPSAWAS
ncbi:sulfatase-like hydrolase/transferase [Reyranella sp.]|uniref:sulfatase-like hydrolase/transferase n=1 Tax=Reyranella sp. TaxID=1929291 RepID=UPI003BAB49FF